MIFGAHLFLLMVSLSDRAKTFVDRYPLRKRAEKVYFAFVLFFSHPTISSKEMEPVEMFITKL